MQQRQWVNTIRTGDEVAGIYLLGAATLQQSRNGPYWRLELRDRSGAVEAKIWSPLSTAFTDLAAGNMVDVHGKAGQYRDQVQITIEALSLLADDDSLAHINLADFMPSSERDPEDMLAEIEALCHKELTHKPWRKFALAVLNDPALRPRLLMAPAAKSVHHAYRGGLLEHSLSVATLCLRMADHYPDLDRQCLFVGALFHDIGKLEEMSGGLANDYTDAGRLIGHISLSLNMLAAHLAKSGLSQALVLHFQHLLLSHHGEPQFGAVRQPATAEAFVLHFADNTDAKVAQCRMLLPAPQPAAQPTAESNCAPEAPNQAAPCTEPEQEAPMQWTPWQSLLGRALCRPPRTPAEKKAKRAAGREKSTEANAPQASPDSPEKDEKEWSQCSLL